MTTLREEIFELTMAYGQYVNDTERKELTDKIISKIEKMIDSIDSNPYNQYDYHCENAVDGAKDEMKESLKK